MGAVAPGMRLLSEDFGRRSPLAASFQSTSVEHAGFGMLELGEVLFGQCEHGVGDGAFVGEFFFGPE